MLPSFQLSEPIVNAMVTLLETELPGTIEQLNETIEDGYFVDPPVQYLPYMPFAATLEGGLPLVAVQRLGIDYTDPESADLVSSVWAKHQYAVIPVVQNADHATLARQLERLMQAIVYTINQDRVKGQAGSVMTQQGGAWAVRFLRIEPGPLLGDLDPMDPGQPPATYLSWLGLVLSSEREEI